MSLKTVIILSSFQLSTLLPCHIIRIVWHFVSRTLIGRRETFLIVLYWYSYHTQCIHIFNSPLNKQEWNQLMIPVTGEYSKKGEGRFQNHAQSGRSIWLPLPYQSEKFWWIDRTWRRYLPALCTICSNIFTIVWSLISNVAIKLNWKIN